MTTCRHCKGPILRESAKGKPFVFCSDDCRRTDENKRHCNEKRNAKRRAVRAANAKHLRTVGYTTMDHNRTTTIEGRACERVLHQSGTRVAVKMPHEKYWGKPNAHVVESRMAELLGVSVVCVKLDDESYREVAGDRVQATGAPR